MFFLQLQVAELRVAEFRGKTQVQTKFFVPGEKRGFLVLSSWCFVVSQLNRSWNAGSKKVLGA